jgi:sulfoxide reductase heme-binding subunit YedZ
MACGTRGMTAEALWYLNRSTGIVLLVTMTLTVVLGALVRRHGRLPGLPRFGVVGLHRNVALLSALLLLTHVATAVVDSYVDIAWVDVLVPFVSGYRPFAVGLGTLALDLLLLVVVTSLLRGRLPLGLWQWVHRTSYLLWPVSFAHGLTAGTDLGSGWLLGLVIGCAVVTAGAAAVALAGRRSVRPAAERAPTALSATSHSFRAGRPVAVYRNG